MPRLSNSIALAVVPTNDPKVPIAFDPKTIPLGLIRDKLALLNTPSVPKIFEGRFPSRDSRIFSIPIGLVK